MKKIMIMLSLIMITNNLIAEKYIVTLDSKNYLNNIQEISSYNKYGFDSKGIHKETGTIYDSEGYNQSGFNSSGFSRKKCFYEERVYHIYRTWDSSIYGYRHTFVYEGIELASSSSFESYVESYVTQTNTIKEIYTIGNVQHKSTYSGNHSRPNTYWNICYQQQKL